MNYQFYLTLLLIISSQMSSGQTRIDSTQKGKEKVILEWKLEKGDTIIFQTLMPNSNTVAGNNILFHQMIKDSEDADMLKKQIDNNNLITYLTSSVFFDDVIEMEMLLEDIDEKKSKDDFVSGIMESKSKWKLLRGSFLKSGKLHSFWLKQAHLNWISLFFELPGKPISIGDTWELKNLALIGYDQNFKCEEAERINLIKLADVKYSESDTIAVIQYKIREYVKGEFSMNNSFSNFSIGNKKEIEELSKTRTVTIDYSINATSEFSITQGKWTSFKGIISANTSGFMGNIFTTQNFALEEIELNTVAN